MEGEKTTQISIVGDLFNFIWYRAIKIDSIESLKM